MKPSWVLKTWALGSLFAAGAAFAADEVKMATSEDLSAFDAQLGQSVQGMAQPGVDKESRSNRGIGEVISAEARKFKDNAAAAPFGQQVRTKAPGMAQGMSAGGMGMGQGVSRGPESGKMGSPGAAAEGKNPSKKPKK